MTACGPESHKSLQDNTYSRFVSWAKVVLPLLALALLSTLFIFARGIGGDGEIPYAKIEEIARQPRLSEPEFSGVTTTGATYAISADVARPGTEQPDDFAVEKIAMTIDTAAGLNIEITAGLGEFETQTNQIELSQLARVATSNGYLMETRGLIADVANGTVVSTAPLEIRSPMGQLTAGRLHIDTGNPDHQMVFNEGVRLVYEPAK